MTSEFNKEQFSNAYTDGIENSYWNIARNKIILKYVKRFKLNNLLDVGCGRGIVTSYLYNAGIHISGADLGAASTINNSQLKIYYNTDALDLPESFRASINTISLFDVIEHIQEPTTFIKSIAEKYPNLKNLVLTVPGREELWTNFDDYYGHFRRYSLKMINKELENAGFNLAFSRYFFHTLYLLIRINNLLIKQRDINFSPPKGFLLLLNRLMGIIFYIESFVVPGKFRGASIIGIYTKKVPTTNSRS